MDNARGILVTLVVAGHLIEPFIYGSAFARAAYVLIYSFHIPGLVFLSGYLSHARSLRELAAKVTVSLLVPYVVLETVYSVTDFLLAGGDRISLTVLTPYWLLWYLPALAAWRLVLPLMSRLPIPVVVGAALALLAGTVPAIGTTLTASRFFVFLPAFLLGHRLASRGGLGDLMPRAHAWVIAAACCAVAVAVAPDLNVRWLYGSQSYLAMNSGYLEGMTLRLFLLVWSLAMTVAFVTLVRAREGIMARIGAVSLYPYVLHGLVVMAGVALLPADLSIFYIAALLILSVPLAAALSSSAVTRACRPLLEPGRYLFAGSLRRGDSTEARTAAE